MNNDKLSRLIEVMQNLCRIGFTGKIEIHFGSGNISSIVKTEKIALPQK